VSWIGQRSAGVVDRALLHSAISGVAAAFELARRLDPGFRRAVAGFSAIYQFSHGAQVRQLRFADGRVTSRAGAATRPDFEVNFIDLRGALKRLRHHPDDVLGLQLENKIQESGNIYYLFRLGYLFGLLRRRGHTFLRACRAGPRLTGTGPVSLHPTSRR